MKIIAIIPARGGSKSILRKNIKNLCGRPLVSYTIDAAIKSKKFDRIILSTDDKEIREYAINNGIEAPFLRPEKLAQDNSSTVSAIQHAVEWLESNEEYYPDIITTLQPTSPLRNFTHISEALSIYTHDKNADSLLSVCEIPHTMSPLSAMKLDSNNYLIDFMEQQEPIFRRQDKPIFYSRNGAICITSRQLLNNRLFGGKTLFYLMSHKNSYDIDTENDWKEIEKIMKKK